MTREEAYNRIDAIIAKHEIDDVYVTITNFMDYDALRIARKTLEQEPCEDCISRAEAIKALEYDLSIEADGGLDKYRTVIKDLLNAIYNTQKKAIEDLPSIQPKTDVLDKIKHEIIELRSRQNVGVLECLDIIDRYKAESEE